MEYAILSIKGVFSYHKGGHFCTKKMDAITSSDGGVIHKVKSIEFQTRRVSFQIYIYTCIRVVSFHK